MDKEKVFAMDFAKIYPLLINKVTRKGRTQEEADTVITWLTGYDPENIHKLAEVGLSYKDFFGQAPAMNPLREKITGSICGIRVEHIEDPLMREIRYLDKLIDELAKGKSMENILRK